MTKREDWHTWKKKQVRKLTPEALLYAKKDLEEVIRVQEDSRRGGGHHPKLGQYWDEYFYVVAELRRRNLLDRSLVAEVDDFKADINAQKVMDRFIT